MIRKIIHIDMDCFYAAVEMRDNPALRALPIAVGGSSHQRGVICSANYEARAFGVRSAMATAKAVKLCPDLIMLPVDMMKYKTVSRGIQAIFKRYTDLVEPLSLDEAYLDVSNCELYQGSATRIAEAIRQDIELEHQVTASAGVAPNKFLAKVASGWNKPNGQWVIPPSRVAEFVAQLPVEDIWGVGKKTAAKMHQLGFKTCADVQSWSELALVQQFGGFGHELYQFSRGIDLRPVNPNRIAKSISAENTFLQDLQNLEACLDQLPELWQRLQNRLSRYQDRSIKNQFVKLKFHNFTQTTIERSSQQVNFELFKQLCQQAYIRKNIPVRLIGLGVDFAEFDFDNKQLSLF